MKRGEVPWVVEINRIGTPEASDGKSLLSHLPKTFETFERKDFLATSC